MLRHVIEQARASGATHVELRVNKGNARALAAYARAGFRIERSLVADIGGGFVMDDHVLRLDLPGG
jgi:ribosomal protein S18 acetylase RimI-like enzyme